MPAEIANSRNAGCFVWIPTTNLNANLLLSMVFLPMNAPSEVINAVDVFPSSSTGR